MVFYICGKKKEKVLTMPDEESFLDVSLRKIAKGAGFVLLGTLIGRAFGYGSRLIIARFLGVSDYGLISLGFAGMSIVAAISLVGITGGITRYVSFYKGKGDKGRIKGTITSALKITLPLSLLFAFILFYKADWISIHVFHDANLTPILRIFSIAVPFLVLAKNIISCIVGFQDMKYPVFVEHVFQNAIKLGAIVILVALGFGVLGATWGWVIGMIVMPFIAFYFLERKIFPVFNTKVKAIAMEKELFSFSFPLMLGGIADLVMHWMDTLMLGYFGTSTEVGIYNAALPTAQIINALPSAFAGIFFPVISELYARNKIDDLRNTYSAVTKWMLSLIFPAFLLTVLFPDQIIKILFGAEYVAGATALVILTSGFLIIAAVGPVAAILATYGKTKTIMASGYIGAGMNFALNFLLIPIYGVNGAAIATASSLAFAYIFNLFFVYRIAKIHPFRGSFLKPIFASIIVVSVIHALTKYVIGASFFILIVMLFVFLVLYFFLLLFIKGFEEEDLMIMKAIDKRLGTKSDWIRKIIQRFL